jgi:hypothetical protein
MTADRAARPLADPDRNLSRRLRNVATWKAGQCSPYIHLPPTALTGNSDSVTTGNDSFVRPAP